MAMQKRPPRRNNPGSPPDKAVAVQRRKPPEEEARRPGPFRGPGELAKKRGSGGGGRFPEFTSRIYAGAGGSSATRPRKLVADEKKVTRPNIDIF